MVIVSLDSWENPNVILEARYSDYPDHDYIEEWEWESDIDGFIGDSDYLCFFITNDDCNNLLSEGRHTISVRGRDSYGEWADWSESLDLEIIYNVRPRIQQIYIVDQDGNDIHESHRHFCCGEIYFEAGDIEEDGEIVEYEWWFRDELISTEISFWTEDYRVGNNLIELRVKDNLGFWSNSPAGVTWGEEEWFFVYPQSPSLEVSALIGDEFTINNTILQEVILEIQVIPSQDSYGYDNHDYAIKTNVNQTLYLSLADDTVNRSLYTYLQYGVHEIYLEICHYKEWYEDDETYHLCSDTIIEVRINTPPIALIEDIGNSDSPASVLFMEKVFFEGRGIDEDGEIVEYEWLSSIDGLISTDESFSTSELSIGTHIITLSVEDNDGRWNESGPFELWIYTNPVAHAGEDVSAEPGTTVQFAGGGTDEDGEIAKYEWDLNGDGIFEFKSDNTGLTTFIYNNEGSFTVTLRVTDNDGNIATDEMIVTVSSAKIEIPDEGLPSVSFVMALTALSLIALRRKH